MEIGTKPVWRQALAGKVMGVPTIQAGTVLAVIDGGQLKAYSLEGKFLWEFYARSKLVPYVTRSREGTCYICTADGILIAVNRAGRELWRLRPGLVSSPILSGWDGRLFVPVGEKLFCYTASGFLLWKLDLEQEPLFGPLLDKQGGMVMVLANGDLLEVSPFGEVHKRSLETVPTALIPAEEGVLTLFKNGEVRLIQAEGEETLLPGLGGNAVGGISRGNRAVLVLSDGKVVQLSVPEAKVLWTGESHIRKLESPRDLSLIYDERGIYVLSSTGATGFSAGGRRLWLLRINGSDSIPAMSGGGMLFSGGADWILYAYKLENRVLREKQSLYGPAPEGSYGLGNPPPSSWADYPYRFSEFELGLRLNNIAGLIQAGQMGPGEPDYTASLMETAGSSLNPRVSITLPPVQVKQRTEAVRLLGFIGSRETIPYLAGVYSGDPDSSVKAEAAEAIGRIGVDPDGIALDAFARTISAAARDEQVLIATASAIGALCRFSGPPLSESGIRLLGLLSRDFMPTRVRSQALRETASLR
jgi:outer membrane protein assembly factor BamB